MSCFCESDKKKKKKIFHHDEPNKIHIHDIHDDHLKHSLKHKPVCVFHPVQEITNFCINPTCYMPLCPICVEEHLERHKHEINSESHIRTFEHVKDSAIENIKDLLMKMHNEKKGLERYSPYPESLKYQLLADLQHSKNKIMSMIETFYLEIQKEIESEMMRTHLMINVNDNLKEVHVRIESLEKNLDILHKGGQKALKKLIILHNHKIYEDNHLYIDSLAKSLRKSGMSMIKIEENPQELQGLAPLLTRYLRIIGTNNSSNILRTASTELPLSNANTRINFENPPPPPPPIHLVKPPRREFFVPNEGFIDRNEVLMDGRRLSNYPPVRYSSVGMSHPPLNYSTPALIHPQARVLKSQYI